MPALYIDIDSLRPDHPGCYGYDAPTTPNIDAFAEDAVRFDRAYVANSPCMPSRAAFTTGRYGINNGVTTTGQPGSPSPPSTSTHVVPVTVPVRFERSVFRYTQA